MAKFDGPRRGSSAFIALLRIVELGGTAARYQLVDKLPEVHCSVDAFRKYVIVPLVDAGYVVRNSDGGLVATVPGKNFAGKHLSAPDRRNEYVGIVAAPRTPRQRALDVSRVRGFEPIRPGAFEYRDIPSLMGVIRKLPSGEVVE